MRPPKALLESALDLASKVKAKALLVLASTEQDLVPLLSENGLKLVVATTDDHLYRELKKVVDGGALKLTFLPRGREKKIVHAVSCGLSEGLFSEGDRLVCLVGEGSISFDSIFVHEVSGGESVFSLIESHPVHRSIVELALELGHPRAGGPVGSAFLVGDERAVMKNSRQLMPNPFKGHRISVVDRKNWDLLRRYATFDGAFVVREDGRVLAAMRYLEARADVGIPVGLGTRHRAVAAATSVTRAMGVTVSGQDGVVRVFKGGALVAWIHPLTRRLESLEKT